MKYLKIYDKDAHPLGVVDVENIPSEQSGKFVKAFDAEHVPAGVIELGASLSDAQKALTVPVFGDGMVAGGSVSAGDIGGGDDNVVEGQQE